MSMLKLIIVAVLLSIASALFAQLPKGISNSTKVDADLEFTLSQAEQYYADGDFNNALPLYLELYKMYPNENAFAYRVSVCKVLNKNQAPQAIPILEKLIVDNIKLNDLEYFLGRAYQYNFDFIKAKIHFEKFVSQKQKDPKMERAMQYIEQCVSAHEIVSRPIVASIKNLRDTINTIYSEYAPLLDPEETHLYYTFRGDSLAINNDNDQISVNPNFDYYEDVYMVTRTSKNSWSAPLRLGEPFNLNKGEHHDATVSISEDGKRMFLYKDIASGQEGDLYMLEKKGDGWGELQPLKSINTKYWERSASLSIDNKRLVFSSNRPGGVGQRDLYVANLLADGTFDDVKNIGENLNSKFNEDAPFFSHDGKYLYFSSEGHNSIGEYDVFQSALLADGSFGKAENLGFPINSIDDDNYFSISHDKSYGFLSSDRAGGFGDLDIYILKLEKEIKYTSLLTLDGTVKSAGAAVGSTIFVYNDKNELDGKYSSSLIDGAFKIVLTGGHNYKLKFTSDNNIEKLIDVEALSLTKTETRKIDVELVEAPVISIADRSSQIAKVEAEKALEEKQAIEKEEKILREAKDAAIIAAKAEEAKSIAFVEAKIVKEKELAIVNAEKAKVEQARVENMDLAIANSTKTKEQETAKLKAENKDLALSSEKQKDKKVNQDAIINKSKEKDNVSSKEKISSPNEPIEEVKFDLEVPNIYFDFNNSVIKQSGTQPLDELVKRLVKHKKHKLEIIGHADGKGDDNYNLRLSKQRAAAIANYVVVRGIKRSRIKVTAAGETMPIAPNENVDGSDNPTGRERNRRVELKVFDKNGQIVLTSK